MRLNKFLKEYKKLYRLYFNGKVFVAFDTETTSLSPSTGRIIEIGAVKFSKDGVIGRWSSLFNPGTPIPPFISELTHITDSMVCDAPKIESKLRDFITFAGDSILIAHNAQFDLNFYSFECGNSGLIYPKNQVIDTLPYSRWAYPTMEKHKLAFLAEALKLNAGQNHRALDDAETCMQLFERIIKDTTKDYI